VGAILSGYRSRPDAHGPTYRTYAFPDGSANNAVSIAFAGSYGRSFSNAQRQT
jgi:hypothetical protein